MEIVARVFSRMAEIPRQAWEILTADLATPILDWSWLNLLETSGSINEAHGWFPRHLTLWRGNDLVAAAPLYKKNHSWGEFVWDQIFAQNAPRLGGSWYPKLVGMSPATPSVGWQVLILSGENVEELTSTWWYEALALGKREGVASVSANFTDPAWAGPHVVDRDPAWNVWKHQNFLWTNRGLSSFEDYLGCFDKNQRRNIRREVQGFKDQGYTTKIVEGPEIPSSWFDLMGFLYSKTNAQFGPYAAKFLEPAFFDNLDAIRDILVFAATFYQGEVQPTALSFLLHKKDRLIGRYWGEVKHVDLQYFNVCYYEPLSWALQKGIQTFDPGAGSALKVRRGFESQTNWSLHRFFDRRSEQLFTAFLDDFNRQEEENIKELNAAIPFREEKGLKKST
jgi:predicted N-acyltransferase